MESTSVITNIRHPVDRVFSAYEFTVRISSRFFQIHAGPKRKAGRHLINGSIDIWPWRFLGPWMHDDTYRNYTASQLGEAPYPSIGETVFDASSYAMPFHDFIHQPIVIDLVHNGATFQLAGLTNNSYNEGASYLRKCVIDHPDLGHHVINVAKRRLDGMTFVGLTEKHKDTATLFAHLVGEQILPIGQPSNTSYAEINPKMAAAPWNLGRESIFTHSEQSNQYSFSNTSVLLPDKIAPESPLREEIPKENITVYGLIETYERCTGHKTQHWREKNPVMELVPLKFSYKARKEVGERTLAAIRRLNSLDLELHIYAQQLFNNQVLRYRDSESVVQRWEPKSHELQLTLNERLYWSNSLWSASRISLLEMFPYMSVVLLTLGLILYVFCNGRAKVFQARRNHTLHEKI